MPEYRATRSFDPTAQICRPSRVRFSSTESAAVRISMIHTGSGIRQNTLPPNDRNASFSVETSPESAKYSVSDRKITIVPRTSGALGYTMQVDEGEQFLMSRDELFNRIATLTGGRTAEELICNTVTTGASNDIQQATRLARAMVTRYGMSDRYDMMELETVNGRYLGGDASAACSDATSAEVDKVVLEMIKEAHEKARKIISENLDIMHEAARFLMEKETITGEEFMAIVHRHTAAR